MSPIRILCILAVLVLAGCGNRDGRREASREWSSSREAGSEVGREVTDFVRGVGHGIDKQMEVPVELSEELVNLGLSKTVSKLVLDNSSSSHSSKAPGDSSEKKAISIYLISQKPLKGQLAVKAFNIDGQEIGRTTVDVDFGADDARYVSFPFPADMDTQCVAKYVVGLRPAAATPTDAQ